MKSICENRRERRITFSLSCGGTFGNELLERTTFEGEHLRDAGRGQPAADPFVGVRVMHIRGGEGEGGGAGHSVNPLRPQHRKQVGGHCARTSEVIFHLSHKVRASWSLSGHQERVINGLSVIFHLSHILHASVRFLKTCWKTCLGEEAVYCRIYWSEQSANYSHRKIQKATRRYRLL